MRTKKFVVLAQAGRRPKSLASRFGGNDEGRKRRICGIQGKRPLFVHRAQLVSPFPLQPGRPRRMANSRERCRGGMQSCGTRWRPAAVGAAYRRANRVCAGSVPQRHSRLAPRQPACRQSAPALDRHQRPRRGVSGSRGGRAAPTPRRRCLSRRSGRDTSRRSGPRAEPRRQGRAR